MTILEPKVELLEEKDCVSHVARCARVCYGKETGDDERTINNLINNNHLSVFRHGTSYYIIPDKYSIARNIVSNIFDSIKFNDIKCVGIDVRKWLNNYYVVCNDNFILDYPYTTNVFAEFTTTKEVFANTEIGFQMLRYTFICTTQISTSRELNRVSPNNIVEQSTRYVYEDGVIVRPHWITDEDLKDYDTNRKQQLTYIETPAQTYLDNCQAQFNIYKNLINNGVKKQDARGVLPLDTATKVIYTYSVKEWAHIISLRSDKRAHPNAQIISNMIKKELENLGHEI